MISNYLKTALINGTVRNTQYTVPTKVYLAIYTTNPTAADTGTECTLGGYARQEITFKEAVDYITKNEEITFPPVTSGTGTMAYFGIRDALTAGNLLFYGALGTPRALKTGTQLIIKENELTCTFA